MLVGLLASKLASLLAVPLGLGRSCQSAKLTIRDPRGVAGIGAESPTLPAMSGGTDSLGSRRRPRQYGISARLAAGR